jgi:hypothetical protein
MIATPGVKQPRRFAPVVFALAICYRQPKRRKQRGSDQKSASGSQSAGFEGQGSPGPGVGTCPLRISSSEAATLSKRPAKCRRTNIDYAQRTPKLILLTLGLGKATALEFAREGASVIMAEN